MRRRLSPSHMPNITVMRPSFEEQDQRPNINNNLGNNERSLSSDTMVDITSTIDNNNKEDNHSCINNHSNNTNNSNNSLIKPQPFTDSDKSTVVGTPTSMTHTSPFEDNNDIELNHSLTTTSPTSTIRKRINDHDHDSNMNDPITNNPVAVVDVVETTNNSISIMGSIQRPPSLLITKKDQQEQKIIKGRHNNKNDVFVNVHNDHFITSNDDTPAQIFQTKKSILLTLGQCLLRYGSPCHRVVNRTLFI